MSSKIVRQCDLCAAVSAPLDTFHLPKGWKSFDLTETTYAFSTFKTSGYRVSGDPTEKKQHLEICDTCWQGECPVCTRLKKMFEAPILLVGTIQGDRNG